MSTAHFFTFPINVTAIADDEDEAREHIIQQMNSLFEADNNLILFSHPGNADEIIEAYTE